MVTECEIAINEKRIRGRCERLVSAQSEPTLLALNENGGIRNSGRLRRLFRQERLIGLSSA
jgi:hypothetical protein